MGARGPRANSQGPLEAIVRMRRCVCADECNWMGEGGRQAAECERASVGVDGGVGVVWEENGCYLLPTEDGVRVTGPIAS